MNINGPYELYYMENPNSLIKRKIYLFGEFHGHENKCNDKNSIDIHRYLEKLFKTSDKYIDFYLETDIDRDDDYFIRDIYTKYGIEDVNTDYTDYIDGGRWF